MNYNDEVEYALKARHQRQIEADEHDLLMTFQFASSKEVVKPRSKQYSGAFLKTLAMHEIDYWEADTTADGKWHFNLPNLGGEADD